MEAEKAQNPFVSLIEVTFCQHIVCQVSDQRYGMRLTRPEAKFLVADEGPGRKGWRARLNRLAGRYDNPMPESNISPSRGLRFWPLVDYV